MPLDTPPTQDLILACRQGDASAWDQLLKQYERLVFSIPLNYGLTREDAADVTQLTFTILLQSLDNLADDSNLAAWLATVARRHTWRLLSRRRRESPHALEDLGSSSFLIDVPANTRPLERWELVEWLEQGLASLNERCRNLLTALYFSSDELSYTEIADQFDMAVGSVGPTRARCLERLKGLLEESDSI